MRFSDFEENKKYLTNQYAKADYSRSDGMECKKLYDSLKDIYHNEQSKQIGKGKVLKHYFENVRLCINPHDIFSDMMECFLSPRNLTDEQHGKYKKIIPKIEDMKNEGAFFANCDFGHTMPDWDFVMKNGICGILDIAEMHLKNDSLTNSQKEFYLSVKYAYEGILIYIKRLYECALKFNTPNSKFAAENLKNLLFRAPETLSEAMQLYFIFYQAQHSAEGENLRSLGALDDILYPFYKHDIENGIDEDEIRRLIRYFLYKWTAMQFPANIPFSLCANTNELTYIILEEYVLMDIIDPKIHIKCKDTTPEDIYEIVMKSIRKGNNSFVFVNDEVAVSMLEKTGMTHNDAENYTLIGCYEPSAVGKELPCTCNGGINMPLAVEAVLSGGKKFNSDTTIGLKVTSEFSSFDEFYSAVKDQLKQWIELSMVEINEIEKDYPQIHQAPIMSATFGKCLKNGVDAYASGVEYNNSSICTFGIATLTDELIAIKKAVFEDKIISLNDLTNVLKTNWKDNATLHKTMMNYPKYANNLKEPDMLAKDITEYVASLINKKPNGRGGVYRLGLFSIDWRMAYGKKTGASADGRKAGEPVSKNMCASVGMDKNGITAIINSVTKFDYTMVPDGTVLDLVIHPSAISGDDGIEIMKNILKVYLNRGGYALQINALDAQTLKKAQKYPEQYKNLQVRLCGWNVYFLDLDIESQNDLIKSMEW